MRNMIHQKDGGQVGKTISHYKILEKIGGGGMGTVCKAEDTKLKRTVALKFLSPELTRDPEAKKRFVQEAQTDSALDHPNICTIHEIDETEDGQMFICMVCCKGETVAEKIERGPLKTEEAIDLPFGGVSRWELGKKMVDKINYAYRDRQSNITLIKYLGNTYV